MTRQSQRPRHQRAGARPTVAWRRGIDLAEAFAIRPGWPAEHRADQTSDRRSEQPGGTLPVSVWLARLSLAILCLLLVGCQTTIFTQATPTPAAARPPTVAPTPAPAAPPASPAAVASPAPPAASPPPSPIAQPLLPASPVAVVSPTLPPSGQAGPAPSPVACRYGPTRKLAEVQDKDLKEASALAASVKYPGVYWTLNDSGNDPIVYALDEQGKSRGTFKVADADNEDWESIQVGPGPNGGSALYIGDTGDNDEKRRDIAIYRVPEPQPGPIGGRAPDGKTAPAEMFKLTYPDGPHDAEALLVHPTTGEILIITKEQLGHATVYRVPLPLDSRRTARLERIAEIDYGRVGVRLDLVTDATVSVDGRLVTVRTYGSGLEWDVPPGAPLASIWGQTPRVFKIEDPPQGEGITYRLDRTSLLTIGEEQPAVWQTPRQC
jgi:hypothetical protein